MGLMYIGPDGEVGPLPGSEHIDVFYFSAAQARENLRAAFWDRRLPRLRWAVVNGAEVEYTERGNEAAGLVPHRERYADSVRLGCGRHARSEMFPTAEELLSVFAATCDRCKQHKDDCLLVPYEVSRASAAEDEHVPAAIMCSVCRRLKAEARSNR